MAFAAEVLARSPWPNSCKTLVTARSTESQQGVVELEELVEFGQLRTEGVELDSHQGDGREPQRMQKVTASGEKNQPTQGYSHLRNGSGSKPLKRMQRMFEQLPIRSLRRASARRLRSCAPWPGAGRDHQPAAVQHAEKLLHFLQGDLLRGKFGLESLLDLVQAVFAVGQNRVFLLLEAIVLQPDGVLDDPSSVRPRYCCCRAGRSGRFRSASFRAELESRLSRKADHLDYFNRTDTVAFMPRVQQPVSFLGLCF